MVREKPTSSIIIYINRSLQEKMKIFKNIVELNNIGYFNQPIFDDFSLKNV